ncbi:hypothetical protein B0H17DRAFT_1134074 [Mycena rosella]|uniref:Uncharacterized protein n=1 Tax=Mycena rosella TaxID=1033263 RepID=A0AAD7DH16_MYCRO|nr:hypothetical protein B0H17DRAFT_1134074 [Mycena rosella]
MRVYKRRVALKTQARRLRRFNLVVEAKAGFADLPPPRSTAMTRQRKSPTNCEEGVGGGNELCGPRGSHAPRINLTFVNSRFVLVRPPNLRALGDGHLPTLISHFKGGIPTVGWRARVLERTGARTISRRGMEERQAAGACRELKRTGLGTRLWTEFPPEAVDPQRYLSPINDSE